MAATETTPVRLHEPVECLFKSIPHADTSQLYGSAMRTSRRQEKCFRDVHDTGSLQVVILAFHYVCNATDHCFGCEHERCYRGGILESRTSDFGWVDDTCLD